MLKLCVLSRFNKAFCCSFCCSFCIILYYFLKVIFGSAVQFLVVLMVNVQLLMHARYITTLLVGAVVFSLLVHVTFIWGLSEFSYYFIDDLEYEHVFMNILG